MTFLWAFWNLYSALSRLHCDILLGKPRNIRSHSSPLRMHYGCETPKKSDSQNQSEIAENSFSLGLGDENFVRYLHVIDLLVGIAHTFSVINNRLFPSTTLLS